MPKLTTFCALALAGLVAAAPAGDALAQSKPSIGIAMPTKSSARWTRWIRLTRTRGASEIPKSDGTPLEWLRSCSIVIGGRARYSPRSQC